MIESFNLIIIAISAFLATNIDDIFLLTILFSNEEYKSWEIVLGQYFGFFVLILISLTAYWLKFVVSSHFLAILGIFPIIIGIKKLLDRNHEKQQHLPLNKYENGFEKTTKITKSFLKNKYDTAISPLAIALITISNGGDNIGIYAPLFASYDLSEILITLAVFFVMVGFWCYIGKNFVSNSLFKEKIGNSEKFLELLMPMVLIFLGISILISNAF